MLKQISGTEKAVYMIAFSVFVYIWEGNKL